MSDIFHAGISGARGRMGRAVSLVLDAREDVVVAARFDRGETPDLLRYLDEHDLVVGASVQVVASEPIAGTTTVRVGDAREVVMGVELCSRIDVDQ